MLDTLFEILKTLDIVLHISDHVGQPINITVSVKELSQPLTLTVFAAISCGRLELTIPL